MIPRPRTHAPAIPAWVTEVNPVLAIDQAPTAQFHHHTTWGGPVKCRSCQQFVVGWSDHLRRRHIGMTTVFLADHLRDVARLVRRDVALGLDPVDHIMAAMDEAIRLGVDDAGEGLATLAIDVMLARVTGSRITSTLHQLADEMAPLPHIG
jgi:hypothetical protein